VTNANPGETLSGIGVEREQMIVAMAVSAETASR
jgi:hypothetical protein